MARPRVFVSSTFYDLRQIRADLERFIQSMGCEPVLAERGSIPYGSQEKLEQYCYREIELADVLVSVVGGRFGSPAQLQPYSISQVEVKTALQRGKQVYVFVERSVLAEYGTYKRNKDRADISYASVDDPRVYAFLLEVAQLPNNNPIAPFDTARDITDYLREQWAGLFQRFLQEQVQRKEVMILEEMQTTAQTLNQLVNFLTEEKRDSSRAVREILLTNHPMFGSLRKATKTKYRIFFSNRTEMEEWLIARGYSRVESEEWDFPEYEEWIQAINDKFSYLLSLKSDLFDEQGKLRIFTPQDWDDQWVSQRVHKKPEEPPPSSDIADEDIPS